MTRASSALAAVPTLRPRITDRWAAGQDAACDRLLTVVELAQRLGVSRSKIEKDVAAGLPCLNLATPRLRPAGLPHARRKRSLRFS